MKGEQGSGGLPLAKVTLNDLNLNIRPGQVGLQANSTCTDVYIYKFVFIFVVECRICFIACQLQFSVTL